MLVTGQTTIMEVLQRDLKTRDIFLRNGMGCVSCMAAAMETVENGARMHGVDPGKLVEEINAYFREQDRGNREK